MRDNDIFNAGVVCDQKQATPISLKEPVPPASTKGRAVDGWTTQVLWTLQVAFPFSTSHFEMIFPESCPGYFSCDVWQHTTCAWSINRHMRVCEGRRPSAKIGITPHITHFFGRNTSSPHREKSSNNMRNPPWTHLRKIYINVSAAIGDTRRTLCPTNMKKKCRTNELLLLQDYALRNSKAIAGSSPMKRLWEKGRE